MTTTETAPTPKKSVWRFAPIAIVVVGLAAAYALGLHRYLSLDGVARLRAQTADFIAGHLAEAVALYVVVYALAAAFSIPGAAFLTIAGGFLFGVWIGGAAALVGALIGATTIFLAAKTAFGDVLKARVGGFLAKLEEGFRANAFNYLLTLRLIPFFPFWVINLAPAFFAVRARDFVLASAIGMAPGAFVYASLGAGAAAALDKGEKPSLSILGQPQFLFAFVGLVALSLLPIVYKALRGRPAA